jgi:hypothetical protein
MGYQKFNFKLLREVASGDQSLRDPYKDDLFITFDIDWACDDVIYDTMQLLSAYHVPATFFCTHDSPLMMDLRENKVHELGIHPNFNKFFSGPNGPAENHGVEFVLDSLLSFFPNTKSLRSHSLVTGDPVTKHLMSRNISIISNILIPYYSGMVIRPYIDWYGLLNVPYYFQDTLILYKNIPGVSIGDVTGVHGLKVFDFHPIHVFLNTENLDRYERTRQLHQNPKELIKHRFEGYGTRSRLIELLELGQSQ